MYVQAVKLFICRCLARPLTVDQKSKSVGSKTNEMEFGCTLNENSSPRVCCRGGSFKKCARTAWETRLLIFSLPYTRCRGDVVLDKARERKLINFYELEDFSLILRATSQKIIILRAWLEQQKLAQERKQEELFRMFLYTKHNSSFLSFPWPHNGICCFFRSCSSHGFLMKFLPGGEIQSCSLSVGAPSERNQSLSTQLHFSSKRRVSGGRRWCGDGRKFVFSAAVEIDERRVSALSRGV